MKTPTFTHPNIEKAVEEFRIQFDGLGLKPPKDSMPNLERELIVDFWRKVTTKIAHEAEQWGKEEDD